MRFVRAEALLVSRVVSLVVVITLSVAYFGHATAGAQASNASPTRRTIAHLPEFQGSIDPHFAPSGSGINQDSGVLGTSQIQVKDDDDLASIPVDLAGEVEGMYRLMDLISESGSNGYGKEPSNSRSLREGPIGFDTLIWRGSR